MARTQGTFSLSANIEVAAGAPLDARDRVSAKSDLTASGAFPYHWIGMETYVVAENKKYRLIGSDPTVLANWEEVGSGGSGGASDLNDLDDVNITSASNGQVLKYDSQNQVWVNANESGGGGASDLNDLDDVNITTPSNGQVLKYDSTSQEWINANDEGGTTVVANPSGTATTDLTKLQVGSSIYGIPEGTTVVANPSSTATADLEKLQVGSTVYEIPEGTTVVANPSGTATDDLTKLQVGNTIYSIPDEDTDALEDLTDVDLTSVSNGQVLKYDSASAKWVNANESSGGSGHTIENSTGTDMTARTNLQFKGAAAVSDDSTNDRTIVDVPKMTSQDLEDILTPLPSPVTAPEVGELSDVNLTSLANGQVLKYDAANQEWINANESGGGASDLDDLSDVNITSPTSGQVLKYDSQNQEWINANDEGGTTVVANPSGTATADLAKLQVGSDIYGIPEGTNVEANPSGTASTDLIKLQVGSTIYDIPEGASDINDLGDVNITSATNGQVLKYDAANQEWVNANESGGGGGASSLDELDDVELGNVQNGQILKYYGATGTWINANESSGGGGGTIATSVPVGTIISVMGTHAPINFLICDGTIYNIADYTELTDYFEDQFGSVNYFGGDGTTTFAVPDLRGEFLRGTGTNSHLNQGNGANVGTHQDGTLIPTIDILTKYIIAPGQSGTKPNKLLVTNADKQINDGYVDCTYVSTTNTATPYDSFQQYTTRPTNTSVLYCIAIKDIPSGIGGSGASQLYELEDVRLRNVIDGQVLKYDAASSRWINSSTIGSSLNDLIDVTVNDPEEDQIIKYDSRSHQWVNRPIESSTATIYGFRILRYESNPLSKVEYIKDALGMEPAYMDFTNGLFNYGSWENAFFMPKPCMVLYDGTVDYYLDLDDYTKKINGSTSDIADPTYPGNAMMEWGQNNKMIWLKIEPNYRQDSRSATIYISDENADGTYTNWPFHNSNGETVDHFYTAIYNASLIDGKLRSMSGQNLSKTLTAYQEYEYAQANNPTGQLLWTPEVVADIQLINFLLILMCKSTNLQDRYGQGVRSGGTESKNNGFLTGINNTKGLFYGTNNTSTSNYTTDPIKIFGMENWWGMQYRRYWGDVIANYNRKVKMTYNMEDGSGIIGYDVNGTGYVSLGIPSPTGTDGGYISEMMFTEKGMFPVEISGSYTTHYCDGFWKPGSGVNMMHRGGYPDSGALMGPFMTSADAAATYTSWRVGTSLSCKPLS